MLKKLFTSRARVKLLEIFLLNPDGEYFIRELTRKLDEQINSIRRELTNLKAIGLLKSRVRNRKKYYVVNKNFIFFSELRSIVIKATRGLDELAKKIQKLGDIDLLVLSGIFLEKDSLTDLFTVGEVNKNDIDDLLAEFTEGQKAPVRMSVMSKEDFLYRLKIRDKFVMETLRDPENLIAVNKLEKQIEDR
jgi:predicted transcriptional regulator